MFPKHFNRVTVGLIVRVSLYLGPVAAGSTVSQFFQILCFHSSSVSFWFGCGFSEISVRISLSGVAHVSL